MTRRFCLASTIVGLLFSSAATALDVNLVGIFPNKALVQIDGGSLRTLAVGDKTREGVLLVAVDRQGATIEIQGRREVMSVGPARKQSAQAVASAGNYPGAAANYPTSANYATVPTNDQGDMVADGAVNGVPVRFVVDTGATLVTISASDAARFGIDYRKGKKVIMDTANGEAFAYQVRLETVRVGGLLVRDIDAVVAEGSALQVALLGMSFLNRVDMKREGTVLTLTRR